MAQAQGSVPEGGTVAAVNVEAAPSSSPWKLYVLVMVLAAGLFLPQLGARTLWSSEGRWAEIAREMRLTSNYFWPTINGKVYYDKPLLSYWLVAGASHLTGAVDEATTRLPCAIASLAAIALLMWLTKDLYGNARLAALSGLILATSYSYVFFSRHASADLETVTGELGALLLFVKQRHKASRWWVIALWSIMALTSLLKGLLGFVLPLAVIGLFCAYAVLAETISHPERRLRTLSDAFRREFAWFFNWQTIVALAAAVLIYYSPFAVSQSRMHSQTGLYMVFRENVVRFFSPFDHRGPIYLYVYVIFALMAPWSAFLPAALVRVHSRQRPTNSEDPELFTLAWFWGTFVFFTLSGSRRSYYLLPILPPAAILIANLLLTAAKLKPWVKRLLTSGYLVLVVVAIVGGAALLLPTRLRPFHLNELPPIPATGFWAASFLIIVAAAFYSLLRFDTRRITAFVATGAYLGMFYLFVLVLPGVESYRGEKPFADQVRTTVGADFDRLSIFKAWGPGLVYYIKAPRPIAWFDDAGLLKDAGDRDSVRWVITVASDAPALAPSFHEIAREPSFPWEGRKHGRSKYVLLEHGDVADSSTAR